MNNNFSLEGKVIIVTGGTGVLGGAFVDGIVDADGTVIILGRNKKVGKAKVAEVTSRGGNVIFIPVDVTNEELLQGVKVEIEEKYGRIDGLVNAAGGNVPEGILSPDVDIFDMNIEGMKNALSLNLWGTVIPNKIFGPLMAKEGGSIINISSVSSKRPLTRVLGYSMGKAALDCYNKWMAIEMANRYGDKLRINSISPGFFLTHQNKDLLTNPDGSWTDRATKILNQTPYNRFGKPEELIGALIWLLSDASQFVTGMDIGVDGGFTINCGV